MISAKLISALIAVESANLARPEDGDGGAAIGPLQIHRQVVEDVNRVYRMHWRHEQVRDRRFAILVCRMYLAHYMRIARLGPDLRSGMVKMSNEELAARIWNGGPHGYLKAATDAYWDRVQEQIQRLAEAA